MTTSGWFRLELLLSTTSKFEVSLNFKINLQSFEKYILINSCKKF